MDIRITPLSSFTSMNKPSKATAKNNFSTLNLQKPRSSKSKLLLTLPQKKTQKPQYLIKFTSKTSQPFAIADKKGVLLYQQVEKNKWLLNGAELVNRFHYKV